MIIILYKYVRTLVQCLESKIRRGRSSDHVEFRTFSSIGMPLTVTESNIWKFTFAK